jgi:TonB family protein
MNDHLREFEERSLKNARALLDKLERDDGAKIRGRDLAVIGGAIVAALLILVGLGAVSSWYESRNIVQRKTEVHSLDVRSSAAASTPPATAASAPLVGAESPKVPLPLRVAALPDLGPIPESCPRVSALKRPQPLYPTKAIESNQDGWVIIEFDLDASGSTSNLLVRASSPKGVFDAATIRALGNWTFPANNPGTGCRLAFTFNLRD